MREFMLTLVVDHDEDYAAVIEHTLRRDGHDVAVARSCRDALAFAGRRRLDLALLDIGLPDLSGYQLCDRLRAKAPGLAVIFVSNMTRPDDIAAGLNRGADDYVTKPFHPGELLARVSAVVRRTSAAIPPELMDNGGVWSDATFTLNRHSSTATFMNRDLHLTPTEAELLELLLTHRGDVLTDGFLLSKVWGYTHAEGSSLLKGHIGTIRRKLAAVGASADAIESVQKIGYRMVSDETGSH
jgi:DNA-binding response OmpR family regulator